MVETTGLYLRKVNVELKRRLKAEAAMLGLGMEEYCVALLTKTEVKKPVRGEVLEMDAVGGERGKRLR